MKRLKLKELQELSVEILKDVHDFCEKNGITYFISYGTLIGAVRHKGFIPWDDDIDIMMKREDYDRFCATYASEKYKLINSDNTPECYLAFTRVCDCTRTVTKSTYPWHSNGIETGVWIDVFPLDLVPRDRELNHKFFLLLNHLYDYSVKIRRMKVEYSDGFSPKTLFRIWVKKTFHHRLRKEDPRDYIDFIHQGIKGIARLSEGDLYGQLCCPDVEEYGYEASDISETVLLDFGDTRFRAPAGYDRILRTQYGDYMQLPPKSDRKPTRRMRAFWK